MRGWLGLALRVGLTGACLAYLACTIPFQDIVDLQGGGRLKGTLVPWPGGRLVDPQQGARIRLKDATIRTLSMAELGEAPEASVHLGLLSAVGGMRWAPMGVALLLLGLNQPFLALRWKALLDAQGIRLAFASVLRLHFLGLFFNISMPGQTGGDVVKSIAVAKRVPGRGTAAVVTVFLDRVVGFAGLVFLAGLISVLMAIRDPRFFTAAWGLGGILGLLVGGTALYLSPLRTRWFPPDRVARLPWAGGVLAEIDRAVSLYQERRGALLASLAYTMGNHLGYILCGVAVGRALGIPAGQAGLGHYFVLIPLVSMVSCLPVSVMGFGIGELAYVELFGRLGVPESKALALSLLTRFLVIGWGLLGGLVVLLTRKPRASPHVLGASQ